MLFVCFVAAVGLRGGGVRSGGLRQTYASRTGRPVLLAPEHSGVGIPDQRVAQSAAREIAPAAKGAYGPFPLSRSMVVAIKTATATVLIVHLLEHLIDHGSFVSDPALSDVLVVLTWLVISSKLLAWAMAASDPPRVGSASDLNPLPPLSDAEAAELPPGLAELLSCIDSSDCLTHIFAGAVCKAMGANHVTDIVGLGHERYFAQELARLVNGNFDLGTVAMSPTKRDMLLEVLTAMSARHVGVVWTKSDQDEAVKSLKARALSERMFRQSESTPRTPEGLN